MNGQGYRPDEPIAITLTAVEWNQVLGILSRGKYHAVAPLIAKITQQAHPEMMGAGTRLNSGDPANVPH